MLTGHGRLIAGFDRGTEEIADIRLALSDVGLANPCAIIIRPWDEEQIIHPNRNSDLLHFKLKLEEKTGPMDLDMKMVELAKRAQRVF